MKNESARLKMEHAHVRAAGAGNRHTKCRLALPAATHTQTHKQTGMVQIRCKHVNLRKKYTVVIKNISRGVYNACTQALRHRRTRAQTHTQHLFCISIALFSVPLGASLRFFLVSLRTTRHFIFALLACTYACIYVCVHMLVCTPFLIMLFRYSCVHVRMHVMMCAPAFYHRCC